MNEFPSSQHARVYKYMRQFNLCAALVMTGFLLRNCNAMSLFESKTAILITGATDGIGRTTAREMMQSFDHVLIHGRDPTRIADTVKQLGDNAVALPPKDLSSIADCRELATDVRTLCQNNHWQLSTVLNNAGVYSEAKRITTDGLELTFAVNVVAPFVLTSLLLDLIQERIVITSSISQCRSVRDWDDLNYSQRPYSAHAAYSESKLLDAMLTMEFAERLKRKGTTVPTCNCLDPGTVNTKMLLDGWGRIGIDVKDALDESWLCSSADIEGVTGKYFVHRSERKAAAAAYDAKERQTMWRILSDLAPDAASMWNFH